MSEPSLSKKRRESLNNIVSKKIGFSCQGKVGAFIDNYVVCEAAATKLVQFYKVDKSLKSGGTLRKDEILNALKHFGYQISEQDISTVFTGGTGRKGTKSARQLRNGFLHSISDSDKNEIQKKYSQLIKSMNMFLSFFRASNTST